MIFAEFSTGKLSSFVADKLTRILNPKSWGKVDILVARGRKVLSALAVCLYCYLMIGRAAK